MNYLNIFWKSVQSYPAVQSFTGILNWHRRWIVDIHVSICVIATGVETSRNGP